MNKTILKLDHLSKYYPGVVALNQVTLEITQGEIHALAGENGAGKSTLIKLVAGAIEPNIGTITINGREYRSLTPTEARECGIGVIYQEFNLVDELKVYENIYLGDYATKGIVLDKDTMRKRTRELFDLLGMDISPDEPVKKLSVGYQQMVEIAKAISKNVKILIMDEPSAPLTNTEVESMFRVVRKLKQQGVTIIYISHRLEEIFSLCDRVSVMRDGELLRTMNVNETTEDELIRLMIGRELKDTYPPRSKYSGSEKEPVLELKHVYGNGVKDISFKLYRGEILGLGGLVGAGRTELAELIFGKEHISSGEMILKDNQVQIKSPRAAIRNSVSLIPEDRKKHGVILHLPIRDNISLPILGKISKGTVINKKKEKGIIAKYVDALGIKTPSVNQEVNHLSGGNQQKVVFAKWMATDADIMILDEPTRGIDVGAKYEIYQIMNELVAQGKSIIMISSEMPELIGMSDRIIILSEGKITGLLNRDDFSQESILKYASI